MKRMKTRKIAWIMMLLLLFQLAAQPALAAENNMTAEAPVSLPGEGEFLIQDSSDFAVQEAVEEPLNPYSSRSQHQPHRFVSRDGAVTLTAADTARTGENFSFSVSCTQAAAYYAVNVYRVEDNAYYTVFSTKSTDTEYMFTFYAKGTHLVEIEAFSDTGSSLGYDSVDVEVSQGAAGSSLEEKVTSLVAQCRQSVSTEYEIALWLHDWLIMNANYDYNYSWYGEDGVLMLGTGACDSYSRAYRLLLNEAGIANQRQTGNATNSAGHTELHAWNLVNIDGQWCQVDCTWDDPGTGGNERHIYFGINDEMMARNHTWEVGSYPVCTTMENFYFYRLGYTLVASDDELDAYMSSAASQKQPTIRIYYIGEKANYNIYSAFSKWFYANNWKYGLASFTKGEEEGEYHITYTDPWDEPQVPDAIDFTMNSPNGRYSLSQYLGNNGLVLVFGRTTCGNTNAFLSGLQSSMVMLNSGGVDVLVSLIDSFSVEDVQEMEGLYPGVRFAYDEYSLLWDYLRLFGVNSSIYFPCIFIINADGKVIYYSTGPVSDIDAVVQEAMATGTGNPIPEPIRHIDYNSLENGTGNINNLTGGTIVSGAQQASQQGYVYLHINYYPDTDLLGQYESNYALYEKLGIRMVASYYSPLEETGTYPHISFAEFDNSDFWKLIRSQNFTGESASYECSYLIDPSGNIFAWSNDSSIGLDDFAAYLVSMLTYSSTIPNDLSVIREDAFANSDLTSIDLNNGSLQKIGSGAFAGNSMLEYVRIPESVSEIEEGAFADCTNLVIICTIGSQAFFYAYLNGILYVCV